MLATVITVLQYRQKPASEPHVTSMPIAQPVALAPERQFAPEPSVATLPQVLPVRKPQAVYFRPAPQLRVPQIAPAMFGGGWLTLACFPWLNFGAWIWAAIKTGNARYWTYAVMYGLPILLFLAAQQNERALHGPYADPPAWTTAMGAISWLVGVFHAIIMRQQLRQEAAMVTSRSADCTSSSPV